MLLSWNAIIPHLVPCHFVLRQVADLCLLESPVMTQVPLMHVSQGHMLFWCSHFVQSWVHSAKHKALQLHPACMGSCVLLCAESVNLCQCAVHVQNRAQTKLALKGMHAREVIVRLHDHFAAQHHFTFSVRCPHLIVVAASAQPAAGSDPQGGDEQSDEEDVQGHGMDGSGIRVEELSQTARQVSRQVYLFT